MTLQLRYLQTLREIGGSQNSTIVFPMPIDLMRPMIDAVQGAVASGDPDAAEKAAAELAAAQRGALGPGPGSAPAGENGAAEATPPIRRPAASRQPVRDAIARVVSIECELRVPAS